MVKDRLGSITRVVTVVVLLTLVLGSGAIVGLYRAADDAPAAARAPDVQAIAAGQARLPLHFEPNEGQADTAVQYLARGAGYTLFLTPGEAVLSLRAPSERATSATGRPDVPAPTTLSAEPRDSASPDAALSQRRSVVRMQLVGADATAPAEPRDALPGKIHYYGGNDPARWRTDIPTYARVQYREVYPGIDIVYYGDQGQLEYDFVVAPGADPSAVRLAFGGAASVEVDAGGDLLLMTGAGTVRQRKPLVYQDGAAGRQEVPGGYALEGDGQVRFAVGAYDARRPLVIDPVLVYGTYLGGTSYDVGAAIAVDSQGNAYVAGETETTGSGPMGGPDFPITIANCGAPPCFPGPGAAGGAQRWAFVTKLNPTGTGLVYSVLLGGGQNNGADSNTLGYGIAVDAQGQAYVTGYTDSPTFPTTASAYSPSYPGQTAAFVTKLNATGSSLLYSTYLGGGGGFDVGYAIAIDSSGNAYVTGRGDSPFFPFTTGALTPPGAGGTGVFVAKVNTNGSGTPSLVYSTRIGPAGQLSIGYGIAVDGTGRMYVTGWTQSPTFPTTAGALSTSLGGVQDGFVLKLNPDVAVQPASNQLVYSTYLGGTTSTGGLAGSDSASAIALEPGCSANCNAYVTGEARSNDFPTTTGAFRTAYTGCCVAFVVKLNPSTAAQPPITQLLYSTFLGGGDPTFDESGQGIAVDVTGQAHVTGYTYDINFPLKDPLLDSFGNPASHAIFVTKLNATASALVYSTGLGTSHGTFIVAGNGIALDGAGNAYVTGETTGGLLTSPGAFDTTFAGGFLDAFAVKLNPATPPPSATPTRTATATPTGTITPTPTITGTPTRTPTLGTTTATPTISPVVCTPRPPVTVQSAPGAPGQLQVTITATNIPHTSGNNLVRLDFGTADNARIDIPGGPQNQTGSFSFSLPANQPSITFTVRHAAPGATHVNLTVVDACGSWPTFVGGGASAF